MEFSDTTVESKLEISIEDFRALGIKEGSTQLKNGHFETLQHSKNIPVYLCYNRPLAEHLLNHLKRRLVHLFGATLFSCMHYALCKTADDNANDFEPLISYILKKNFHVTTTSSRFLTARKVLKWPRRH